MATPHTTESAAAYDPTTSKNSPGTPQTLGLAYATAVHRVLETTDTVSYRAWRQGRWDGQGPAYSTTLRRDLLSHYSQADTAREEARRLGHAILELAPQHRPDVLTAMHNQLTKRNAELLAVAITRYQRLFPSCHHVCPEHKPYGLGIDSEAEPIAPDGIIRINDYLRERAPSDIGSRYEIVLHSAAGRLATRACELDEADNPHNPSRDPRAEAADGEPNNRQRLAEDIVYIEIAVIELNACANRFTTYNQHQATEAFAAFHADNQERLTQRIHDAHRRLQPDEDTPRGDVDWPDPHEPPF